MSKLAYTYCVIRYVHDPAAAESMNIGIVLYAPDARRIEIAVESHVERLTNAFRGFSKSDYKQAVNELHRAALQVQRRISEPHRVPPTQVADILPEIAGDQGLSIRFGIQLAGLTSDLAQAAEHLFSRFVSEQAPEDKPSRRDDNEVWTFYKRELERARVVDALKQKVLTAPDIELKFAHAFKNGAWHVLQPLSLDYSSELHMQKRAAEWLGNGYALKAANDLAQIYILLGAPHKADKREAFDRAKALLAQMPVPHTIVEESEAAAFADRLAKYMREHHVPGASGALTPE